MQPRYSLGTTVDPAVGTFDRFVKAASPPTMEALRDGLAEPGPAVLTSLYDEAVLLSQLVDDLQDVALCDAGQLTLHRELTDADELVASAVRSVQPEGSGRGISVRLTGSAESVFVWVDARRVGQVLRNLLANARVHVPPAAPGSGWRWSSNWSKRMAARSGSRAS
jgi:signal transduction histidine kinase